MKCDFLVDYLEFTYLCKEPLEEQNLIQKFFDVFPEFSLLMDDLIIQEKFWNYYTVGLLYLDELQFRWNPEKPQLGVHVVVPSRGLYKLCELFNISSTEDFALCGDLFRSITERGCQFTRLDLCYDDYDKVFTPHDFEVFAMNDRIRTRIRNTKYIRGGNQGKASTFYLGRRGSDKYIRIYDKDFESNGRIPAIRYEFELRYDYVKYIVNQIVEGIHFSFADLLDNTFCIIDEYDLEGELNAVQTRKSRANVIKEWHDFVETIRKTHDCEAVVELKIDTVKRHISFSRCSNFINKQAIKSVTKFIKCVGWNYFQQLVDDTFDNFTDSDIKELNHYLDEKQDVSFKFV